MVDVKKWEELGELCLFPLIIYCAGVTQGKSNILSFADTMLRRRHLQATNASPRLCRDLQTGDQPHVSWALFSRGAIRRCSSPNKLEIKREPRFMQ